MEYKRPTGAHSLRDFHKNYRICTSFQDALVVEISLDLLKGLWSYEGLKVTGSGYPKFSAPSSGENVHKTRKRFRGAITRSRSSIPVPSLVGLGFHPPLGQQKR